MGKPKKKGGKPSAVDEGPVAAQPKAKRGAKRVNTVGGSVHMPTLRAQAFRSLSKDGKGGEDGEEEGVAVAAPKCVTKMKSDDPATREQGCQDTASFVLNPCHCPTLRSAGAHFALLACLCNEQDTTAVRAAAAAGIRNCVAAMGDEIIPELQQAAQGGLYSIVANAAGSALCAARDAAARLFAAPHGNGNKKRTAADEADEEDAATYEGALAAAEEFLLLASSLTESSEEAVAAFSSHHDFLLAALAALEADRVQIAAASLLHSLSDGNPQLAQFFANLAPEQQGLLDAATTTPPTSPSLLRVSLHLCGALLNTMPTVHNVARVMPFISAALGMCMPVTEARKAMMLFSEECQLPEETRQIGVAQTLDRLAALQTAMVVLASALAILCDGHADDETDEAQFAANPNSATFLSSDVGPKLVAAASELLSPALNDAMLSALLRGVTPSSDVCALQQLFIGAEVAVFGAVASVMLLLTLSFFGASSVGELYRACVDGLATRHSMAVAATISKEGAEEGAGMASDGSLGALDTPRALSQFYLQLESLAELCWTVQRKANAEGAVNDGLAQQDMDVFHRVAWDPNTTAECRRFVISAVAAIGSTLNDSTARATCGRFALGFVTEFNSSCFASFHPFPSAEACTIAIRACAADALIDLFSSDDFDDSAYVPLNAQRALMALLSVLKGALKSHPDELRLSGGEAAKVHEVAMNLSAFLQYKRQRLGLKE